MRKLGHLTLVAASVASMYIFNGTAKAEAPKSIPEIISHLADRMYATGETSPSPANFEKAIAAGRQQIKDLMATGNVDLLTEKDKAGTTPLMLAAYFGFAGIVEELLTHKEVRESVNEADSRGLAAWIYTNFALKEALWVCNPSIKNDPFKMIPLMVQQPYYLAGPEPAYLKVRSMLEEAGATHNMGEAKRQWDSVCKNQDAETQRRASSADDLLVFVRREGQERLAAFMKDAAARQNQK